MPFGNLHSMTYQSLNGTTIGWAMHYSTITLRSLKKTSSRNKSEKRPLTTCHILYEAPILASLKYPQHFFFLAKICWVVFVVSDSLVSK